MEYVRNKESASRKINSINIDSFAKNNNNMSNKLEMNYINDSINLNTNVTPKNLTIASDLEKQDTDHDLEHADPSAFKEI